jgi:membrane dipeptidase
MSFSPKLAKLFTLATTFVSILLACSDEIPQSQIHSSSTADTTVGTEQQLIERARGIHEQVITLDTHADINTSNFALDNNYTMDLDTQVTLPKMKQGGLDVAWFIVYTKQSTLDTEGYAEAYNNAIDKFDAIHRLAEEIAPEKIEIAYNSDDVRHIVASGKKVAMIGIENAYPIGLEIAHIKKFQERGGRYMSLAHNGHNQFSDSHTGELDNVWLHGGLSAIGKTAIAEMNKWGVMIDVSHPSADAIEEMIELTQAPLIASHSSARALSNHSRNLSDKQLLLIKENGGVVQTVAFGAYLNGEKDALHKEAMNNLITTIATELGHTILDPSEVKSLTEAERLSYQTHMEEINQLAAPRVAVEVNTIAPPVAVTDLVDHIDYMVDLIGLKHVGISSDFDGGGGISGWNDASETLNVTVELVRRGYTEEQISMLWSGNLLRVLDDVQRIATEIQREQQVI